MKSSASEPGLRLPSKALDITSFKIVEYDQEASIELVDKVKLKTRGKVSTGGSPQATKTKEPFSLRLYIGRVFFLSYRVQLNF